MLLEAAADKAEPEGLLAFLVALLNCCPEVEDFRRRTLAAYRTVHGDNPAFAALLEASGLEGSRRVRRALKLLETGCTRGLRASGNQEENWRRKFCSLTIASRLSPR